MHIPDGYLSPATCATMFAAAAPFWYVASQRIKKTLNMRMVPLLSVFAAFSFIIMMFNLPLPGGTTGHATGVAIAAIVLGPWASMIAVSVALVIQAVFFGDGGILAIGANCFNMAIVGSLVAHWVYQGFAGKSPLTARRRVIAAALAGYCSINVAAFITAVEFGVQPLWFTDAAGTPLYAPYGLNIAIPAMMIGHLTIAGLAELIVTAGVVAYLQRSDLSLLAFSTPTPSPTASGSGGSSRRLWLIIAGLMVLTPLGLLAAGTAWGEWSAQDLVRGTVTTSALPQAPAGLARLESIWQAPLARYALPFASNAQFAYILSAMLGIGTIILVFVLVGIISTRMRKRNSDK
ncbi:MAG: cobalt transporter CbiM [Chloroflexales bacterium]|nr:cobalt transporter CbiM [Chloroflexales bacterium]